MLDAKIAHAAYPDLTLVDGVLDGPPGFEPRLFAAVGAVEEEEVDVAEAACFDRLLDRFAGRVVGGVGGELGGVVDVGAL